MKKSKNTLTFNTKAEFARFGTNVLAYVRKIDAVDFSRRYPEVGDLPDDDDLWALFAADGSPIAIADEKGLLVDDATERELVTVARH